MIACVIAFVLPALLLSLMLLVQGASIAPVFAVLAATSQLAGLLTLALFR